MSFDDGTLHVSFVQRKVTVDGKPVDFRQIIRKPASCPGDESDGL
jgi:hypothetical protein